MDPRPSKPIIAGLTGGIATGKSTVAGMFRGMGAAIIDADQIAREVVQPQAEAWHAVVEVFGADILTPDNEIDRPRLGQVVFNDPQARQQLEAILHPIIHKTMVQQRRTLVQAGRHALILEDIPLLFEKEQENRFKEVIVVYVPESLQIKRLMQRDKLDAQEAQARLDSQISIEIKRLMATRLIDNSGSRTLTRTQVQKIYHQLTVNLLPCQTG